MVESAYGKPCRCATRATARSPSWCIRRVKPVGAKANGTDDARPSTVVVVSTPDTSRSDRRCELQRLERPPRAAQADLRFGCAVGVIEGRPGDTTARHAAEIGNGQGVRESSLCGVELDRSRAEQWPDLGPFRQLPLAHEMNRSTTASNLATLPRSTSSAFERGRESADQAVEAAVDVHWQSKSSLGFECHEAMQRGA